MIDQSTALEPSQIAELLRAASTMLQVELNALPPQALRWHPKPSEWCIQQVLGHLIETEQPGFAGRIRTMVESQDPKLVSLDQNEEALQRRDCERDAADLLKEFTSLRNMSVALVAGLQDADLQRGGFHPDAGYLTIKDLLHEWVYHDQDHIRQIMANIQDFVWAHLGNTQSFYKS